MNIMELEEKYVFDTYEIISSHFSSTRYSHWNGVKNFILHFVPNKSIKNNKISFLDFGCGNGKYLSLCDQFDMTAYDNCENLLQIVKTNYPNANIIKGDICDYKPNLANSFDVIISIAVIHHLSTESRRICAIKNIIEYLKPGAHALISVWSNYVDTSKFIKLNDQNDWLVGWNNQVNRYYHLFEKSELENIIMCANTDNKIEIVEIFFEQSNWFVEIKKNS